MEELKCKYLFTEVEEHTIAYALINECEYPWQILPKIKDFILSLGPTLSEEEYYLLKENVWVAKSAKIAPSADITGPAIICEGAEIRPSAFIRGSAIVGRFAVVGNSTELKNAILFDRVQVPHFNYIGDSVLGYRSHTGAGAITSNVKSDKTPVTVKTPFGRVETGLKKFGAILGDCVEVGCNSVMNPGTVIGKNSNVYPLSSVRGYVPENSILKNIQSQTVTVKKS